MRTDRAVTRSSSERVAKRPIVDRQTPVKNITFPLRSVNIPNLESSVLHFDNLIRKQYTTYLSLRCEFYDQWFIKFTDMTTSESVTEFSIVLWRIYGMSLGIFAWFLLQFNSRRLTINAQNKT